MKRLIRIALMSMCLALSVEARTWTSLSGKQIEAEFVSEAFGQVTLKNLQGENIGISLAKLSPADREYIQSQKLPAALSRNTATTVRIGSAVQGATAGGSRPQPLLIGVDANYSLDMEKSGKSWSWNGEKSDLFAGMARQGVSMLRVRLWTKDGGDFGKLYATEVVKRSLAAGLKPFLVLFLSDNWSDLMKQPVPKAWKALSFEERVATVRTYSRDVVAHFRQAGLQSHVYAIGNEIDYGICGEYAADPSQQNPAALSANVWPRTAQLILASQAGIKEADPDARFMLHVAHWWDADFCIAFFKFMLDQGVQIDDAALSYYPSSNIGGSLEMEQFGAVVSKLAAAIAPRPIVVAETAYPSTSDFSGQFGGWKVEVPGYPLTPDGQRRWIADFLAFCQRRPDIQAVYYWSPEWHGEGIWKAFALFDPQGEAKPAWSAFSRVP